LESVVGKDFLPRGSGTVVALQIVACEVFWYLLAQCVLKCLFCLAVNL
jgi:hypothetical protein